MSLKMSSALAGAIGAAAAVFPLTPAFAHAVCGSRIFPATLAIDDPGVSDELALPTLTYIPVNSDGGLIYMADIWQFAVEALIPINAASGHNVGVVGELHFFLDDIFPNSLGKPLFGGRS